MNFKKKNAKFSLLIIVLLLFSSTLIFATIKCVGLDDAVEAGNVDDAWDYPDNDDILNDTLGTGIKVAIIDTGIDWQHPDFYRPNFSKEYDIIYVAPKFFIDFDDDGFTNTKEGNIVNLTNVYKNQTLYTGPGIDIDMDYGYNDSNGNNQYDFNETICYYIDKNHNGQLDTSDKAVPLEESKIAIIRDYSSGKIFVNGKNLTDSSINDEVDTDGHGTHVAGIVAAGWPEIRNVTGVTPNCTLLIYKVSSWNNQDVSKGIYDAINDGANVISLSYYEYFLNKTLDGSGSSGGGSIVEDAIDYAYSQGVPVVVAAGNFGNKDVHSYNTVPQGSIPPGFRTIAFSVPNVIGTKDCKEIEFLNVWIAPNQLIGLNVTVSVAGNPPIKIPDEFYGGPKWNGSIITPIPIAGGFLLIQRDRYNSNFNNVNKSYMNIKSTAGNIVGAGSYSILNFGSKSQNINSYINSNFGGWYSGLPGASWAAGFANNNLTIPSPATANHAIIVGSFISCDDSLGSGNSKGDISLFSSHGPRVDDINQLDIIAPGEVILSTASRNITIPYKFGLGNYTLKRGTSMAAPYVAGVIALAMSNKHSLIGNPDAVELSLKNSAIEDAFTKTYGNDYNDVTGYGKVDAYNMLVYCNQVIPPGIVGGGGDDDDGAGSEASVIYGYNLVVIISFIGLISAIILRKQFYKKRK